MDAHQQSAKGSHKGLHNSGLEREGGFKKADLEAILNRNYPSFSLLSGTSARAELKKQMQENSLIDKPDPGSAGTYIHKCFA